jgi:hypothetical protein
MCDGGERIIQGVGGVKMRSSKTLVRVGGASLLGQVMEGSMSSLDSRVAIPRRPEFYRAGPSHHVDRGGTFLPEVSRQVFRKRDSSGLARFLHGDTLIDIYEMYQCL